MHLPGYIMSQLRQPPWRHFVSLSQFESPHLGQSLRVSRAYLGYILGNFWPYLWHIYKKTIVQLAFFGRQIVPSDKMSHFLPGDKMSQLMHLCTGKLWKVVGTFCRLSHFVSSVRSSYSHPDLLLIHHQQQHPHFFRSHRSSTLDFHFLSHYSYIKAIMQY